MLVIMDMFHLVMTLAMGTVVIMRAITTEAFLKWDIVPETTVMATGVVFYLEDGRKARPLNNLNLCRQISGGQDQKEGHGKM